MFDRRYFLPLLSLLSLGFVASPSSANWLVEKTEETWVRRNGGDWEPAWIGLSLNSGDLLRVDSRAATYRCVWYNPSSDTSVTPGEWGLGSICPSGFNGQGDPRGGNLWLAVLNDRFEPQAQFLDGMPRLRWPAVAGVTDYRVTVRSSDSLLWEATTAENAIAYGGEALEPEREYTLEVRAMEGENPIYRLKFATLTPAQAATVRSRRMELEATQTHLNPNVAAYSIAQYLAGVTFDEGNPDELPKTVELYGAIVDALSGLDDAAPAAARSLLGDAYFRLGWFDRAELEYDRAIAVAGSEAEALDALEGMAFVAAMGDDPNRAEGWLKRALDAAEGQPERVRAIEEMLEKLELVR